jgi:asparagine synthase (glutamine-hydrolysing)
MCGLIAAKDNLIDIETFHKALYSISYRGDKEPKWEYHNGGMVGHVALPLCSLDPVASYQPVHMFAFVGEIFNYKDFGGYKNDVQMLRNTFLHYDKKQLLEYLHKMDGFWSIAFIQDDSLYAITDYLSQKPIYYRTDMNVVASEIDALRQFGPVKKDQIFMSNIQKWGYDSTGRTPWEEIKQMPPGSIYRDGVIETYWNWDKIDACTDIVSGLHQATSARIHVARPLSLLLSGGLDSSIVYTLAKEIKNDIEVFHVENDESRYADLITTRRTDLTTEDISDKEAIQTHQSPVDLGSVKPQIALANAIQAKGYHVVLTGDGADELFGGYRRSNDYDSQMSDIFMELPYYHLPRLDRTMMKATIEVRTPFLAPYIVKYAMELKRDLRTNKKVLKQAFSDVIPSKIIDREKLPLKTTNIRQDLLFNTQNNIQLFEEINND